MTTLATAIGRGTNAARPAAGFPGRLWYDTTNSQLTRDNGTTWDVVEGAGGLADMGTVTYLDFTTAAAPANPAAGKVRVYSKTGDTLAERTSAGVETVFGAGGGGATYYTAHATSASALTDSATAYDLTDLSIANVPAGTYLALVGFLGSVKSGTVRVTITDGTSLYYPSTTTPRSNAVQNADGLQQYEMSGVVVLTATTSLRVQAEAVGAVNNWSIYDRHFTLIKIA